MTDAIGSRPAAWRMAFAWVVLAWPALTFAQSGIPEGQLVLLDGTSSRGVMAELTDSSLSWQVTGESAPQRISLDQVRSIDWQDAGQQPSKLTLWFRDDSQIYANQLTLDGERVQWTDTWNQQRTAPRSQIRAIFPKGLAGISDAMSLVESIETWQTADDGLLVQRDGAWSSIEGRVGQLSNGSLEFSIGDQTAQIPLERAGALVFGSLESEPALPRPMLTTVDGQRFSIAKLQFVETKANLESELGLAAIVPADQLAGLAVALSKSVWLSDLTPTTNDWRPWLATPQLGIRLREWHLARFNVDFEGHPVALATRDRWDQTTITQYERGVAIAAGGRLAFQLGAKYQRLTGLIGFAPAAHPAGDLELTVSLDGQVRMQTRLNRNRMLKPLAIDIPVAGAQRLLIEVGYGDGRAVGDQLHLVDWELTE